VVARFLRQEGAGTGSLAGVPGLHVRPSGRGVAVERWAVAHGLYVYLVTFIDQAADRVHSDVGVASTLRSWHWTPAG